MTIPNVTILWCRKQATCHYCGQPIEIGTAMVKVFFWNKGNEDKRYWNTQHCYHLDNPACWVKQGLDYLEKNPFVPHVRGRVRALSKEDSRKRYLLVRRFNEMYQRKNNIKAPYPDNLPIEARLIKQMVDIMMEVAGLGGVPKSWAEKIN